MANGSFIENFLGDLKHAARALWRSPAFAATAIAAVGSVTAMPGRRSWITSAPRCIRLM